ncbi:syntaxin-7-like [Oratosquilla oratoria]|uniref:syntaxin-7-like n=1 Tax=Oratosquilla oratoria TaxID=337810 RepID=UPI003F7614EB
MASGYTRLGSDHGGGQRSYGSIDSPSVGFESGNTSTEFFKLCDTITTNLFTINKAASTLEKALLRVGTPQDNQDLRDRIRETNSYASTAVQDTTAQLRSLQPLIRSDKQRKIRQERLRQEFQAGATRFSEIQKKVVETVRVARLPSAMLAAEQDAASATSQEMEAQEQQRLARMKALEDMEFENAMHLEREQSVRQLETDIVDLNEVMKELSSMVTQQSEVVDSIENNVETAHGHVEEGREELAKAAQYQSKYRRRLCILILILIVVLGIIGIVLGIQYSN